NSGSLRHNPPGARKSAVFPYTGAGDYSMRVGANGASERLSKAFSSFGCQQPVGHFFGRPSLSNVSAHRLRHAWVVVRVKWFVATHDWFLVANFLFHFWKVVGPQEQRASDCGKRLLRLLRVIVLPPPQNKAFAVSVSINPSDRKTADHLWTRAP